MIYNLIFYVKSRSQGVRPRSGLWETLKSAVPLLHIMATRGSFESDCR